MKKLFTDYYFNNYKCYRKWRNVTWYKHEFTEDALYLSITFVGTFWALYGNINRYSKVIKTENKTPPRVDDVNSTTVNATNLK